MYLILLVAKHVYDCTLLREIEWGGMESREFMKLSDPFFVLNLTTGEGAVKVFDMQFAFSLTVFNVWTKCMFFFIGGNAIANELSLQFPT